MSMGSSRSIAVVLFVSALVAFAVPAAAEPVAAAPVAPAVRARVIAPHVALTGLRATAHPLVFHETATALPFALHPAPAAPIKALPLVAPVTPLRAVPAFLPRLGLAALPDLAASDRCASPRPGVILSALPTTPFTPMACERDLSAGGQDLRPSLVPGHNKKALYGPGYTPRSSDDDP